MFETTNVFKNKYQLDRRLGNTAIGRQTWLAKDLETDELVVIKLLAFNPETGWKEIELFEREGKILKALNHDRIPKYRDYFDINREEGGGIPWFALVQDYIAGLSLQEAIENGQRFTEAQVQTFATEILDILIYLHELSPPVLHRDIKPSNLIFGEDKHIYLIDFGSVQAQAAVTGVSFTVVGTSGYAPLEQFWGRSVAASDIYALGATLIHLLTGIAPDRLSMKDSRLQFRDRVSIRDGFLFWLEKATESAAERRFKTARIARDRSIQLDRIVFPLKASANQRSFGKVVELESEEIGLNIPLENQKASLVELNRQSWSNRRAISDNKHERNIDESSEFLYSLFVMMIIFAGILIFMALSGIPIIIFYIIFFICLIICLIIIHIFNL
jgi:serine/threonine protein kinase